MSILGIPDCISDKLNNCMVERTHVDNSVHVAYWTPEEFPTVLDQMSSDPFSSTEQEKAGGGISVGYFTDPMDDYKQQWWHFFKGDTEYVEIIADYNAGPCDNAVTVLGIIGRVPSDIDTIIVQPLSLKGTVKATRKIFRDSDPEAFKNYLEHGDDLFIEGFSCKNAMGVRTILTRGDEDIVSVTVILHSKLRDNAGQTTETQLDEDGTFVRRVVPWGQGLAILVTREARELGIQKNDYVRVKLDKI